MKVDFNAPILNPYGAPLPQDGDECLRLGHLAVTALTSSVQGDKRSAVDKVASFKLSQRLFTIDGDEYHYQEVELKRKEIDLLTDLIERVYPSPLILARALELLDPEEGTPSTPPNEKEG